jgi:hypothetical protein
MGIQNLQQSFVPVPWALEALTIARGAGSTDNRIIGSRGTENHKEGSCPVGNEHRSKK